MTFTEKIQRIQRIDRLIRIKATGSPKQLAQRLQIGERTVYDIIKAMRELGAPIKYCTVRESYYYEHEGSFNFNFTIPEDKSQRITGGQFFNSFFPSLQKFRSGVAYLWNVATKGDAENPAFRGK